MILSMDFYLKSKSPLKNNKKFPRQKLCRYRLLFGSAYCTFFYLISTSAFSFISNQIEEVPVKIKKKITKNYSKKSLTNYTVNLEILNRNNKLDIFKKKYFFCSFSSVSILFRNCTGLILLF